MSSSTAFSKCSKNLVTLSQTLKCWPLVSINCFKSHGENRVDPFLMVSPARDPLGLMVCDFVINLFLGSMQWTGLGLNYVLFPWYWAGGWVGRQSLPNSGPNWKKSWIPQFLVLALKWTDAKKQINKHLPHLIYY